MSIVIDFLDCDYIAQRTLAREHKNRIESQVMRNGYSRNSIITRSMQWSGIGVIEVPGGGAWLGRSGCPQIVSWYNCDLGIGLFFFWSAYSKVKWTFWRLTHTIRVHWKLSLTYPHLLFSFLILPGRIHLAQRLWTHTLSWISCRIWIISQNLLEVTLSVWSLGNPFPDLLEFIQSNIDLPLATANIRADINLSSPWKEPHCDFEGTSP